MNSILTAILNGMLVSAPMAALILLALRFIDRRILRASARYAVWWMTLAITVTLPLAYLPAHHAVSPVRFTSVEIRPTLPPSSETEPRQSWSGLSTPRRLSPLPLSLPAGQWTLWLSGAWVFTSSLFLLRLVLSCFQLHHRKMRSRIIPSTLSRATREIRMAVSEEIPSPMAAGFRHPAILLPVRLLDELVPSELEFIGLHEAAHLDRRDDYALIVERVIEALFALHPIVRWIARQIDLEREIACDDRVVGATGQAHLYAACLTRVAELTAGARPSFAAAGATEEGSHLTRRVEMLLDKTRHTGTRWLKTRLSCALAVVFALAWMAAHTPTLLAFTAPPAPQPARSIQMLEVPAAPQPMPRLLAQAPQVPPPSVNPAAEPTSTTPVVIMKVQVLDADGRFVADLQRSDFRVLDDGAPQEVPYFALMDGQVSIGVLVDSPDGVTLPLQEELVKLQKRVHVKVEFILAVDPTTKLAGPLQDALDLIERSSSGTEGILLLTNRPDVTSRPRVARIYVLPPDHPSQVQQISLMGGSYYLLGFVPKNRTFDGSKFRNLRVIVDRPGLLVDTRSGYFLNSQPSACKPDAIAALALPANAICP